MQTEFSRKLLSVLRFFADQVELNPSTLPYSSITTGEEKDKCVTRVVSRILQFDLHADTEHVTILWYPAFRDAHILGKNTEIARAAILMAQVLDSPELKAIFKDKDFESGSFAECALRAAASTSSYPDSRYLDEYQGLIWDKILMLLLDEM